jgi:hypothetical protein
MSLKKIPTLSASSLGLFKDCPRCFWLRFVKGIYRPDTIFPSLPGGMDNVIKVYFDKYRAVGLPPELEGKIQGKLFPDQVTMDKWRARRGGLWYEDKKLGARVMGLLDDCLVDGTKYLPLDYKTRGWPPKDDTSHYYQHQIDMYGFLLEKNSYPAGSVGYLMYWWPKEVREDGVVEFSVESKEMEVNPDRAYALFERAVKVIDGDEPAPGTTCTFCAWGGREDTSRKITEKSITKSGVSKKRKSSGAQSQSLGL